MNESQIADVSAASSDTGQAAATLSVVTLRDVAARVGSRTIWRGASAHIGAGEFVAVIGPNGAGKSTLLRLLLGLLPPSQGQIEILGQPPQRGNAEVAYVPQRRALDAELAVRGRDLVALGVDGHRWGFALPGESLRRRRKVVAEALELVEATTYADRPIGQLSGGEQQRLLIAQALVARPRLLLLDEPLASLDLRNQTNIAQLVARLVRDQGITVMLVAHDVNPLLPLVHRIVCVARGQVVSGAPDKMITTERLSALYDAPIEVLHDDHGRTFVVGMEQHASAHGRQEQ